MGRQFQRSPTSEASEKVMPYKDYEQAKKRMRDLYYEKVHGIPAPPLKARLTVEQRAAKQKAHAALPEVKQRRHDMALRRLYGITWSDKVQMYQEQKGLCGLCGQPLDPEISKAHVDHNHETSEVRLLLHKQCNSIVAYFEEDLQRLETLVAYLGEDAATKGKKLPQHVKKQK